MKRILVITALAALGSAMLPVAAAARTFTGRITSVDAVAISVLDREVLTFAVDANTTYSKIVTQRPWQQSTRLDATALRAGYLATVHTRGDDTYIADWVMVATDMPLFVPAAFGGAAPGAATDILAPAQLKALIASAKTPADHMRLEKHYLAMAAKYDAEAADHTADAKAYRNNPTFLESKNPVGPGTAAHCDRFAELSRELAKEARDLAAAHGHMADAVK